MAETELTTDIPEHSDLTPKDFWDQRARGLGATLARPAVSGAEENVLCYASDRYIGESILVHEFSHAIFNIAVELDEPAMRTKLDAAFAAAKNGGLFTNTGTHNEIGTRAQLKTYDPTLAALIAEVFGDRAWRYACPAP